MRVSEQVADHNWFLKISIVALLIFLGTKPFTVLSIPDESSAQTRSGIETIDLGTLIELTSTKGVTIYDLRTPGEYFNGHIIGAELLPQQFSQAQATSLSEASAIVLYSSSKDTRNVIESASRLSNQAHCRVLCFIDGYEKWAALKEAFQQGAL